MQHFDAADDDDPPSRNMPARQKFESKRNRPATRGGELLGGTRKEAGVGVAILPAWVERELPAPYENDAQ
jgi:hypothetical protein